MVDNIIVMAGGAGKRLWPASLGRKPKQFMKIDGEKSLLRGTLDRAFALDPPGLVYIVTHENHVDAGVAECQALPEEMRRRIVILGEPIPRNTAPALALGAARMVLDGRGAESSLVLAADHLISPFGAFAECVETASVEADAGFIVPYGILPRGPATGYGYLESGDPAGGGFQVRSFREKPDAETAAKYASSGHHYWNAGIFTYRNDVFLRELESHAGEVHSVFLHPKEEWFRTQEVDGITVYQPSDELRDRYAGCPSISIDYAVMEKTSKIRMVAAKFQWNDVGSWDIIAEIGGVPEGRVYSYESEGNFVYSDRPVALCGVEDLIVVVANERVMICRKGQSQLVKNAAEDDLN